MSRPLKHRRISEKPRVCHFKPDGVPFAALEEIQLTVDEFEALRLADLERLYQEEAAGRMGISRQTFGNIIEAAHRKLADAIVNGKSLKIAGGAVQMPQRYSFCLGCRRAQNADLAACAACLHKIQAAGFPPGRTG